MQHIHDNPDGDLSLDALAEVAAMSRFQWHRVFRAMTGETSAQAVRRVRALRAAQWLVSTDWSVEQIAVRAGYGTLRGFNRSFRELYGMTPSAYRRVGNPGAVQVLLRRGGRDMHDVRIEERPSLRLAALGHTGPYIKAGRTFEQVSAIFTARDLWPQARGMVGVYYDDPGSKPEGELRADAGIVVEPGFPIPDGLHEVLLDRGPCAVLRFKGPYSELHTAYDYLYGEWLPQSGREPAERPPYEVYLNTPRDVAPQDLLTEICAPLVPVAVSAE
ncbi:AraC family transcriptional regulator [Allosediminivita pacifica]|uniref:AraC family transcriptional regulator n=1 Tax=Allosediminivita pacifica TaxID=1267769 RepID=A0A2T6A6H5_9RHOB|nr:AraC family transcriptional regulator [Allosediminivita pacifica]PTX39429.1 AraC family transcriptional regulator [Allosediminivita pacifica]GGB27720.1 AraC family transcriptional regulator [Allosediminivita pacifica]